MLETATCRLRTPELNVASGQSASISSSRCSGRPWCSASSMSRQRAFGRRPRQPTSTPSTRRLKPPRQRSSIFGDGSGSPGRSTDGTADHGAAGGATPLSWSITPASAGAPSSAVNLATRALASAANDAAPDRRAVIATPTAATTSDQRSPLRASDVSRSAAASTRPFAAPTSSCTTVCTHRPNRASHGQPSISAVRVIVSICPTR